MSEWWTYRPSDFLLFAPRTYYRLFERPFNQLSVFLSDRLEQDFWHDYVHDTIIVKGFNAIADLLANPVDLGLIDWTVNGVGRLTTWVSSQLREVQTGYVRTYALSLLLGVIIVLVILLLPWIQQALAAAR